MASGPASFPAMKDPNLGQAINERYATLRFCYHLGGLATARSSCVCNETSSGESEIAVQTARLLRRIFMSHGGPISCFLVVSISHQISSTKNLPILGITWSARKYRGTERPSAPGPRVICRANCIEQLYRDREVTHLPAYGPADYTND